MSSEIGADPARDLIDLEPWSRLEIERLLDRARQMRELDDPTSIGRGRVVGSYFGEVSTRTSGSFAAATHRLGANILENFADRSSERKGETLEDTARTLDAFGIDVLVVRHSTIGSARRMSAVTRCALVNAGDGTAGHPTQGLLDALTLLDALGDLEGKRIAIVGDLAHSRVARSSLTVFRKLGASVLLCAPREFIAADLVAVEGVEVVESLDEVLPELDAIEALRVQRERHADDGPGIDAEAMRPFRLDAARAARLAPHARILHPGPMNRGVEITDEVADGNRSLIWQQVANGVLVRMAVLERSWRDR